MAFINVSKVTLDDSVSVEEAVGDVMLLCASLVHDDIREKKYDEALNQIEMLKCSIWQLEHVLKTKQDKG